LEKGWGVKFKTLFIGLIVFCFIANPAFAMPERGDDLLWGLTAQGADEIKAVSSQAVCFGYVSGMIDSYKILSAVNPSIRFICLPRQGISTDQATRIIVKWLQEHPERLHETPRILVFDALRSAFPCPK
jgi:hypothetical protein